MNELLELLGMVDESKKADAQKLVDAIKTKVTDLDTQISSHERLKLDAIKTRDEMKTVLKNVATQLGATDVENINEAIDAIKSKKGVDKIAELEIKDREIEALKGEVTTLTSTVETVKKEAQAETMNVVLERDLALVLPKYKAVEELAPYMMQDIKKLAHFEDGKVVFKNEDGTTVRIDGKDATLDDMVSQKREAEVKANKGIFFNVDVQNSGASNNGGTKVQDDFIP